VRSGSTLHPRRDPSCTAGEISSRMILMSQTRSLLLQNRPLEVRGDRRRLAPPIRRLGAAHQKNDLRSASLNVGGPEIVSGRDQRLWRDSQVPLTCSIESTVVRVRRRERA